MAVVGRSEIDVRLEIRASYRWASPRPRCHFEGSVRDDSRPRESGVGTGRRCRAQRSGIEASHKLEETTDLTWDAVIGDELDCGFSALSRGNSANGCARFRKSGGGGLQCRARWLSLYVRILRFEACGRGPGTCHCHGNCSLRRHHQRWSCPGFVATSMADRSR